MDDASGKIQAYLEASELAKWALEERAGHVIENIDIHKALLQVLSTESAYSVRLTDLELTADRILELLKDYNFRKVNQNFSQFLLCR